MVIDKEEPGMGCSSGNMGWIVPSLSDPVPAPGLFKTTFQWMMKSDSPLYIKPSALPSLTRWIYHFRKYCNEADFKKGYEAGLEISRDTLSLFDELEKDENIKFEVYKKGLLFVFLNEKYIEEKYNIYCHAEKIGLSAPVPMSKKELLKMEPALSDNVAGGLYLPDERHTRPESLTKAIKDWLVKNGAEVKSHSEVKDFVIKEDEIVGVKTLDETIEGDYFLITTGVLAADMLNKIGVSFPMTAGKGYSITITSPSLQLQQPLYLGDSRVTLSPFSDSLRVGGTMELSGINTNLDQRRIKSLLVTLQDYLKTPLSGENQKELGRYASNDT